MIVSMPLGGFYGLQRFRQFNPADCANWYLVEDELGKKKVALYPCLGRRHITFQGQNKLIFTAESRLLAKSINYWYNVVEDKIFRIDEFFNEVEITGGKFNTIEGDVFFTYLIATDITFAVFVAGHQIFVYREDTSSFDIVNDPQAPSLPKYIATFGNRILVSQDKSSLFYLSRFNLDGNGFDPSTCFSFGAMPATSLFAQESGIIGQIGVLQNTLYIFTDYTVGVWNNIPTTFTDDTGVTSTFPWKKNTTYDWDFGIAYPNTLSIDFGMMVWVSKNRSGLIQAMAMQGSSEPKPISDKAIDVLLQRLANQLKNQPFNDLLNVDGFLYDYENTMHYRVSEGPYTDYKLVDQVLPSNSFEYNFDNGKWNRCIEKNGERNRVQKHVFFANRHFVSVLGNKTVYEFSGEFYNNEIENPNEPNLFLPDAYSIEPMRYEIVTPIISAGYLSALKAPGYYAELETKYVEIDMVWGDDTYISINPPFDNILYKPHLELLYSDDGGVSYLSADVLEISAIGKYQWRMRWYQLGCHRNRVYKLIGVSLSPIVILGGVMEVSNVSGGAA